MGEIYTKVFLHGWGGYEIFDKRTVRARTLKKKYFICNNKGIDKMVWLIYAKKFFKFEYAQANCLGIVFIKTYYIVH